MKGNEAIRICPEELLKTKGWNMKFPICEKRFPILKWNDIVIGGGQPISARPEEGSYFNKMFGGP